MAGARVDLNSAFSFLFARSPFDSSRSVLISISYHAVVIRSNKFSFQRSSTHRLPTAHSLALSLVRLRRKCFPKNRFLSASTY
jgi:hypothetical protein